MLLSLTVYAIGMQIETTIHFLGTVRAFLSFFVQNVSYQCLYDDRVGTGIHFTSSIGTQQITSMNFSIRQYAFVKWWY